MSANEDNLWRPHFCVLCGVIAACPSELEPAFQQYANEMHSSFRHLIAREGSSYFNWLHKIRALRAPLRPGEHAFITGIGYFINPNSDLITAPNEYKTEFSNNLSGEEKLDNSFLTFGSVKNPHFPAYPFHDACWQQFICTLKQYGVDCKKLAVREVVSDLLYDIFQSTEQSWPCIKFGNHTWNWSVAHYQKYDALKTLILKCPKEAYNPDNQKILSNIPKVEEKEDAPEIKTSGSIREPSCTIERLPPEILENICYFLGSKEIIKFRLSSCYVSNLHFPPEFWVSRFWPGRDIEYAHGCSLENNEASPDKNIRLFHNSFQKLLKNNAYETLTLTQTLYNRRRIWHGLRKLSRFLAHQAHHSSKIINIPKEISHTPDKQLLGCNEYYWLSENLPEKTHKIEISLVNLSDDYYITGLRFSGEADGKQCTVDIGHFRPTGYITCKTDRDHIDLMITRFGITAVKVEEKGAWHGDKNIISKFDEFCYCKFPTTNQKTDMDNVLIADSYKLISVGRINDDDPTNIKDKRAAHGLASNPAWLHKVTAPRLFEKAALEKIETREYHKLINRKLFTYMTLQEYVSDDDDDDKMTECFYAIFRGGCVVGFVWSNKSQSSGISYKTFWNTFDGVALQLPMYGPHSEFISKIVFIGGKTGKIRGLKVHSNMGTKCILADTYQLSSETDKVEDSMFEAGPNDSVVEGSELFMPTWLYNTLNEDGSLRTSHLQSQQPWEKYLEESEKKPKPPNDNRFNGIVPKHIIQNSHPEAPFGRPSADESKFSTYASLRNVKSIQLYYGSLGSGRQPHAISGLRFNYKDGSFSIVGQWIAFKKMNGVTVEEDDFLEIGDDESLFMLTFYITKIPRYDNRKGYIGTEVGDYGYVTGLRVSVEKSDYMTNTVFGSSSGMRMAFIRDGNGTEGEWQHLVWIFNEKFDYISCHREKKEAPQETTQIIESKEG